MKSFNQIIEETLAEIGVTYKNTDTTTPAYSMRKEKRNANNHTRVAGKYFKGNENTTRSMVSDGDRALGTEKGQLKAKFETHIKNRQTYMSQRKFNNLLNDAGERSIKLKVGEQKTINSKDGLVAELMPDGRVLIKRITPIDHKRYSE